MKDADERASHCIPLAWVTAGILSSASAPALDAKRLIRLFEFASRGIQFGKHGRGCVRGRLIGSGLSWIGHVYCRFVTVRVCNPHPLVFRRGDSLMFSAITSFQEFRYTCW